MRLSSYASYALLSGIDNSLRVTLSNNIKNVNIKDKQWRQGSFPIKTGSTDVASATLITLSMFSLSSASTQQLQIMLSVSCTWQLSNQHFDSILDDWWQHHYLVLPPIGSYVAQPDDYYRGSLTAIRVPQSGDWFYALPITSCGIRLGDNAICVALGLCLGACVSTTTNAHALINVINIIDKHSLLCQCGAERTLIHNYLNDCLPCSNISWIAIDQKTWRVSLQRWQVA